MNIDRPLMIFTLNQGRSNVGDSVNIVFSYSTPWFYLILKWKSCAKNNWVS